MADLPPIDYSKIAQELLSELANAKYQMLQWKNLCEGLQAELDQARASLAASAPSPEPVTEDTP